MVHVFQNKFQTRPSPFRLMPLSPVSLSLAPYTWAIWKYFQFPEHNIMGLFFVCLGFLVSLTLPKMPSTWSLYLASLLSHHPAVFPWSCFPSRNSLTFSGRVHHSLLCDRITVSPPLLKLWVSLIIWGLIAWTFAVVNCKNCHPTVSIQIRNPSQ